MLLPLGSVAEYLKRVDVAHDVVYVVAVHDNLRVAALDELLLQLLDTAVDAHGVNLSTGHHAIAHADIRELERVLENLHLIVNVLVVLGIVYAGVYQVVEVYLGKSLIVVLLFHADTHYA